MACSTFVYLLPLAPSRRSRTRRNNPSFSGKSLLTSSDYTRPCLLFDRFRKSPIPHLRRLGLYPPLLPNVFPGRRHQELVVPVGMHTIEAIEVRNMNMKRLRAMGLLTEHRLRQSAWRQHLDRTESAFPIVQKTVTRWSLCHMTGMRSRKSRTLPSVTNVRKCLCISNKISPFHEFAFESQLFVHDDSVATAVRLVRSSCARAHLVVLRAGVRSSHREPNLLDVARFRSHMDLPFGLQVTHANEPLTQPLVYAEPISGGWRPGSVLQASGSIWHSLSVRNLPMRMTGQFAGGSPKSRAAAHLKSLLSADHMQA